MAALRNDFLHPIARLPATSGDPGSDLLRHLSPRRFASRGTRPPASQGAGNHRESKPRGKYRVRRSFSSPRTTRLAEEGRTVSRSRDWLLSPARLARRRHCRRGSPPLSLPTLSPIGLVCDAPIMSTCYFPRWESIVSIASCIPGSPIPRTRQTRFSLAQALFGSASISITWFEINPLFEKSRSTFWTIPKEPACSTGPGSKSSPSPFCTAGVSPASPRKTSHEIACSARLRGTSFKSALPGQANPKSYLEWSGERR